MTVPSVSSSTSLYSMTSAEAGLEAFLGSARVRDASYISRFVVLSRVKGDDGVGAVSSLMVHSGGGIGSDVAAGRDWLGPRVRTPPVSGEGVKVFAGWGLDCLFGGSRVAG